MKARTNDRLTPRKDGRKWIMQSLSTVLYSDEIRGGGFALYGTNSLSGRISDLVEKLLTVRDYYEERRFRSISIKPLACGCGEIDADIELYGYRLETKAELAQRTERNTKARATAKKRTAAQKKAAEEHDRREFERLKKKFGAKK